MKDSQEAALRSQKQAAETAFCALGPGMSTICLGPISNSLLVLGSCAPACCLLKFQWKVRRDLGKTKRKNERGGGSHVDLSSVRLIHIRVLCNSRVRGGSLQELSVSSCFQKCMLYTVKYPVFWASIQLTFVPIVVHECVSFQVANRTDLRRTT